MISFPVDEAHLTASPHPTMDGKMFEVTTTANQAKRYVQGSLCLCVSASALLVSSSGLSHVPRRSRGRTRLVGDALHFHVGSLSAQNPPRGSPSSLPPGTGR